MSETWTVLRDKSGLNHLLHDDGHARCGTDVDGELLEWPVNNAAVWCSACLQVCVDG